MSYHAHSFVTVIANIYFDPARLAFRADMLVFAGNLAPVLGNTDGCDQLVRPLSQTSEIKSFRSGCSQSVVFHLPSVVAASRYAIVQLPTSRREMKRASPSSHGSNQRSSHGQYFATLRRCVRILVTSRTIAVHTEPTPPPSASTPPVRVQQWVGRTLSELGIVTATNSCADERWRALRPTFQASSGRRLAQASGCLYLPERHIAFPIARTYGGSRRPTPASTCNCAESCARIPPNG